MLRRLLPFALLISAVAFAEGADAQTNKAELSLTTRVAHGFTVSDAHVRIQQMLDYWHQRFGVETKWDGECAFVSGKVWGVDFRAKFDILDGVVNAESTDPGPILRGRINDYTVKKLKKYLSPNYAEP
ncbi:MAG: hypothetical protein QM723_36990 [Myxococcaceae bacterium]